MTSIIKYLNKIDDLFVKISALTLFLMMLWIFSDVALRTLFNSPIKGTIEITGEYFMVIIVYLAVSYTQKNNGHINVTLLIEKLPRKVKSMIKVFTNLIAAIIFILIGRIQFITALSYFQSNRQSSGVLNYPLAPALMIISLGIFMIVLRLIIESIAIISKKDSLLNSPLNNSDGQNVEGGI